MAVKQQAETPMVQGAFRRMRRTEGPKKKQYPTLSVVLSPDEAERWNLVFAHVLETNPLASKSLVFREVIGFIEPEYLTPKEIAWVRNGRNPPDWAK